MTAALYTHGLPTRMSMLEARLAEDARAEMRECYIGDALWTLTRLACKELRVPALSELMHEERVRDDRTARDIIDDVLAALEK